MLSTNLKTKLACCLAASWLVLCAALVQAENNQGTGKGNGSSDQSTVWLEEQTGATLPLEAAFLDENGTRVTFGELLDKPMILMPIYFYCPNSCPTNLANMAVAMDRMRLQAGKDYRAVALSFNHNETPEQARYAKRNYMQLMNEAFPESEWNFLTGSEENISAVLEAIGYSFKSLPDGTFIHPSALVAVAEDGTVIKYVYGSFIPGDVEIALKEADRGIPARSIKRLLNYCFNYDPDKNKSFFQTTKLVVLLLFGGLVLFFFVRFIRRKDTGNPGNGEA
jgi:protein SCO1/2